MIGSNSRVGPVSVRRIANATLPVNPTGNRTLPYLRIRTDVDCAIRRAFSPTRTGLGCAYLAGQDCAVWDHQGGWAFVDDVYAPFLRPHGCQPSCLPAVSEPTCWATRYRLSCLGNTGWVAKSSCRLRGSSLRRIRTLTPPASMPSTRGGVDYTLGWSARLENRGGLAARRHIDAQRAGPGIFRAAVRHGLAHCQLAGDHGGLFAGVYVELF